MDKIKAFPRNELTFEGGGIKSQDGMELRDWFAGQALIGMLSCDNRDYKNKGANGVKNLTKYAYEYADAMMKARGE